MAKISVKSSGGWKGGGGFVLGVSMGSVNHEGESLAALVDWINQSSFTHGIIDVSDTLNRYSFMSRGFKEDDSRLMARAQGDTWLKKAAPITAYLKKDVKIIRWDTWLDDERYPQTLRDVQSIYDRDSQFRMAVYQDISNFFARREIQPDINQAKHSISYFLEEIAAHTLLHRDNALATIYPGKQLESYRLIRSGYPFPCGIAASPYVRLVPYDLKNIQPALKRA